MHIDLKGKTAIVTGSTRGIGYAIAAGLAGAGATVVITGRKQADVEAALARLRDSVPGAQVRGVAADLGSAAGFATLLEAEPVADIVVNNVGIFQLQPF